MSIIGEPNGGASEDCVVLKGGNGKFHDVNCNLLKYPMCDKRKFQGEGEVRER